MRLLLQRVERASVEVEGATVGAIGRGLLVFLGIRAGDDSTAIDYLVERLVGLRIFADDAGKMNRSVVDVGGAILVVSQFTLYGDCRKGRRPSFTLAAPPEEARVLYDRFVQRLGASGLVVQTGSFGAMMQVELVNDGPVTFILESQE